MRLLLPMAKESVIYKRMEHPQTVTYKGEKFWLQTTGRYYQSGRHSKNAKERILHRRIWIDNFGAIPDGMEIHHKNGDWTDNTTDNLELTTRSVHQRNHMMERMKDPAFLEKSRRNLDLAREAAKAWHGSPEGLEWHRQHGKNVFGNQPFKDFVCDRCSEPFKSKKSGSRFCSNSCQQRARRIKLMVPRSCEVCGTTFQVYKYEPTMTCSRKCREVKKKLKKLNYG